MVADKRERALQLTERIGADFLINVSLEELPRQIGLSGYCIYLT
jgi:hypothetical protein